MNIFRSSVEGIWEKYGKDIEVSIQLPKFSEIEASDLSSTSGSLKHFMSCVVDWKNITEGDDKVEFKCNTQNKKFMFDYHHDFRDFVWEVIRKRNVELEKELKN